MKFIFGLRLVILTEVFVQRPATLLEAKRIAEKLELAQSMVKMHQKSGKERTMKAAQHSGTQERRSSRLRQSYQDKAQWKTCADRIERHKTDFHTVGCISAQRGAQEVSYLEVHGLAAMWRSMLKDLPLGDRARFVRRQGFVMTVDLEALTHEKERRLFVDTIGIEMSMHPPSGRPWATRVYLHSGLLRRDRERRARDCVKKQQYVTGLLETLVSPTSGGTESCTKVTTSALQGWQSIGLKMQPLTRKKAMQCLRSRERN